MTRESIGPRRIIFQHSNDPRTSRKERIKSLIRLKCAHQKWLDSPKYNKVKITKTQEFSGETYYVRKFQFVETETVCEESTFSLSVLMLKYLSDLAGSKLIPFSDFFYCEILIYIVS